MAEEFDFLEPRLEQKTLKLYPKTETPTINLEYLRQLFLSKDRIHASRTLDYMVFVLKSIFQMNMDSILEGYLKRIQ